MTDINQFLQVNWVDGMKINKSHFLAIQNYVNYVANGLGQIHLTDVNFGLISNAQLGNALKFNFFVDNHKMVKVKLDECKAISRGGERIFITPIIAHFLNVEAEYNLQNDEDELRGGQEKNLLINVSVNPYNFVPFGEPDPDENPPRYPFLVPEFSLSIVPETKNKSGFHKNHLTIGKIIVNSAEAYIDETYIPACTTVESHPKLLELHGFINRFYGQLEIHTIQIIQKIHTKNQNNHLSMMILDLSDKISMFLAGNINASKQTSTFEPPVYMLDKVVSLGRVMKNYVDSKSGSGKEELLNYFAEWCSLQQGDFEIMFSNLVNTDYDHSDMYVLIDKVITFIRTIDELFASLSRLDYIGRKKETGIFVKERQEATVGILDSKPKNRKSFLED